MMGNNQVSGNGVNYKWLAQRTTTVLIGVVGFWASMMTYAVWTNSKAIAVLLRSAEQATP